jgi:hypothetical protein
MFQIKCQKIKNSEGKDSKHFPVLISSKIAIFTDNLPQLLKVVSSKIHTHFTYITLAVVNFS